MAAEVPSQLNLVSMQLFWKTSNLLPRGLRFLLFLKIELNAKYTYKAFERFG